MKKIPFLLLLCLTGCVTSGGIAKIMKSAGQDRATFHVEIVTTGLVVKWDRANPDTNTLPHTVGDGRISVTK